MIASPILYASFFLVGLLVPPTIAVPGARKVMTPHGERPVANVHTVPAGKLLVLEETLAQTE